MVTMEESLFGGDFTDSDSDGVERATVKVLMQGLSANAASSVVSTYPHAPVLNIAVAAIPGPLKPAVGTAKRTSPKSKLPNMNGLQNAYTLPSGAKMQPSGGTIGAPPQIKVPASPSSSTYGIAASIATISTTTNIHRELVPGSPKQAQHPQQHWQQQQARQKYHYFSAKNLVKLDPKTRAFKFQNEAGDVLTLTPAPTLMKYLKHRDPKIYAQADALLKACHHRKREVVDPQWEIHKSLKVKLKPTVGKARRERVSRTLLEKKREQEQQVKAPAPPSRITNQQLHRGLAFDPSQQHERTPAASADSASSANVTGQQKKAEHRFLIFFAALMKYLKHDPQMYAQANAQVKECYSKNQSGNPQFASLTKIMKARLRATVGETHWKKAHDYLDHTLDKTREQMQQQHTQQPQQEQQQRHAHQSHHQITTASSMSDCARPHIVPMARHPGTTKQAQQQNPQPLISNQKQKDEQLKAEKDKRNLKRCTRAVTKKRHKAVEARVSMEAGQLKNPSSATNLPTSLEMPRPLGQTNTPVARQTSNPNALILDTTTKKADTKEKKKKPATKKGVTGSVKTRASTKKSATGSVKTPAMLKRTKSQNKEVQQKLMDNIDHAVMEQRILPFGDVVMQAKAKEANIPAMYEGWGKNNVIDVRTLPRQSNKSYAHSPDSVQQDLYMMLLQPISMPDLSKRPALKNAASTEDTDAKRKFALFDAPKNEEPPLEKMPKVRKVTLHAFEMTETGSKSKVLDKMNLRKAVSC